MALKKKPVTGMKDMLPKEMEIRDYVIHLIKEWILINGNPLRGAYRESLQQAGRGQ